MTNYSLGSRWQADSQDVARGGATLADCDYKLWGNFLINQINSLGVRVKSELEIH